MFIVRKRRVCYESRRRYAQKIGRTAQLAIPERAELDSDHESATVSAFLEASICGLVQFLLLGAITRGYFFLCFFLLLFFYLRSRLLTRNRLIPRRHSGDAARRLQKRVDVSLKDAARLGPEGEAHFPASKHE